VLVVATLYGRLDRSVDPPSAVLGTRAEAVALSPVVRALRRTPGVRPLVVSTGRHQDLLEQVLRPLG
jgi:UDP-N-acetylglucosamine 2-epimerase (non-hydrolysing)